MMPGLAIISFNTQTRMNTADTSPVPMALSSLYWFTSPNSSETMLPVVVVAVVAGAELGAGAVLWFMTRPWERCRPGHRRPPTAAARPAAATARTCAAQRPDHAASTGNIWGTDTCSFTSFRYLGFQFNSRRKVDKLRRKELDRNIFDAGT